MKSSTVAWVLLLVPGFVAAGHAAPVRSKAKVSDSGSIDRERQPNRLVARFRAAAKDPEERKKVVEEAIEAGSNTVSILYNEISQKFAGELKRYTGKFYQKAVPIASQQINKVDLQEVARLRQTVMGLQKAADFTKESIVAKGDPALKRLDEIFVVDRRKILEQSDALQQDRKRLFELGLLWEKCAVFLYNELPDDDNKPKEPPSFEKFLQGEEELAAGLSTPMDQRTRGILYVNARLAPQVDPEEYKTMLALNLTRNLLGLSALAIDVKLCAAARDHSSDMRKLKFFAHESPVEGKKQPWDRAKLFGTTAHAENIAMGCRDGKDANLMWFHSPGHHKNMLSEHGRVGVGRVGLHYTELFGQ